ncbi:hypothetical protein Huta_1143 [Halorhabdus utahensis DSM 12940]|uniref:DUF5615 domain-containing protein n=1 Tax=Halorhabdus utahensis (strain DSM 12940 / JCM 11049 / AX-2) TaxID=519442 RepID=C7NMB1_HALUD|nr:DUF5615 family PIN-like protein [Halorhabdus utahensis]ACV11319.1 hypothetical protein Huta_1143 [Halorhabdus utahensis DSM 12940]
MSKLLLDEHVSRICEHVLRDRGFDVSQAKDRFGEYTTDEELLQWCDRNDVVLVSNNARDFELLHRKTDHAGLLIYYDQSLPDDDPEGFARTVEEVFEQYGAEELRDEYVEIDTWYEWLQD